MGNDRPHEPHRVSILFVCLGNICRSPLAEGVFLEILEAEGIADRFEVDSAGTGAYHVGEPPDPRSADVAERNGVLLRGRARQAVETDLASFDYVVAMDRSNLGNLQDLVRGDGESASLHLLRDFDPEASDDRDVPDPYYGGPDGFDRIYEMIRRSCHELLRTVRDEHDI